MKRAILGIASFQGRARRSEFLYYWIAMLLAGVFIQALVFLLTSLAQLAGAEETAGLVGTLIIELSRLLLFLPLFALFARRLHDQDLSAWGLLILLPVVLLNLYDIAYYLLTDTMPPDGPGWLIAVLLVSAIAFFGFAAVPGTKGTNSYGPDPREDDLRAAQLEPGSTA
ncbi:DUF805 domain-containing protein [Sphingomonas sp. BT-65]|uniref:DUF805 domain-containing protein n=1 Tax=Sphingomonas sp. BT-65 TaxID=2989821 RepID=UPI002235E762|nr:DUF805 domain-containing protein [Sphingomonas sp. BT-65]MCW4463003.1 DUF805 domain-containing protein [Sphingomonas sp. BT-65]